LGLKSKIGFVGLLHVYSESRKDRNLGASSTVLELLEGTRRSTMDELAAATAEAYKVFVF
jgi:hypothetical protein